jgi:pyridoxal phosphate enzyme (YggS family)
MGGSVADNLRAVRARIAAACAGAGRRSGDVELLAVSKRHPESSVRTAHAAGQRLFGENRVQELVAKARDLSDLADLRWHLVGSLQTNKVRELLRVPGLALVHSLDRPHLADALQRELAHREGPLDALLQIDATGDPHKHGCRVDEAPALLEHTLQECPSVRVRGLMAMGPLHGEPLPVFERVARLRDELAQRFAQDLPMLSLGMSDDLEPAIAAGSTLLRIGTAVFGPRD